MLVPGLSRIGMLMNPASSFHPLVLKIAQAAGQKSGLAIVPVQMRNPQDLTGAFAMLTNERVGAVLLSGDPLFLSQRQRIAEIALKTRLPAIFTQREYVEAGGLMSYGDSLADLYRRAAFYVDKILKGAKPADLPIQRPTKFHTAINRKTAEVLALTIPLQLLVLSDELIE
jgi:putative ABC transport system substrate-binding protein